jgi:lipid II:glycine glycyltransferase (peptidoglycan interpeptide bridge formation enzyme)
MSLFKTICHGGVTDVIAFQEEGFRTSVQFTHEIPIQPIEETWKKMRDKTRNCIRRAQEIIKVKDIDDPKQFLLFYEDSLRARGSKNRINARIAVRLIAESLNRQRGRILGATDKSGKLVAAIFCVWDQKSYFYIMSMREESADKGAISLLIWEAIQDAANRSLTFDFTGLSTKGSARFYGGFGGPASPRYIVIRATHLFRILYEFRTLVHKENPFF